MLYANCVVNWKQRQYPYTDRQRMMLNCINIGIYILIIYYKLILWGYCVYIIFFSRPHLYFPLSLAVYNWTFIINIISKFVLTHKIYNKTLESYQINSLIFFNISRFRNVCVIVILKYPSFGTKFFRIMNFLQFLFSFYDNL